jgi:hypothetical protein
MLPPTEVCREQCAGRKGGYSGDSGAIPPLENCEREFQDDVTDDNNSKSQGYNLTLRDLHGSLSPVSVATMMIERTHGHGTLSIGDQ